MLARRAVLGLGAAAAAGVATPPAAAAPRIVAIRIRVILPAVKGPARALLHGPAAALARPRVSGNHEAVRIVGDGRAVEAQWRPGEIAPWIDAVFHAPAGGAATIEEVRPPEPEVETLAGRVALSSVPDARWAAELVGPFA